MTRIDIELPDALKSYLEEESRRRGFRDPSAFVQSLLEAERGRRDEVVEMDDELEAAIREGLQSPSSPWTKQTIDEIRQEGLRLIRESQG